MRALFALALAALTLSGCGQPKQIYVDHGFVRLAAVAGHPAAAYFTLHGGAADATLINVNADVAIRTEMHETMAQGNMSAMKPIAQLPLPADSTITFEPGGKHVMLFDLNPGVKPGNSITLTLTFSDGLRIQYGAPAIAAADPAPKS